jgi:hypothetical protein
VTSQQVRTAKRLALLGCAAVVLVLYAGVVEFQAVVQGGQSTISELMRLAWIHQPGAILVLCVLAALVAGILLAHFWWAGSATYDALEKPDPKLAARLRREIKGD